MDVSTVIQIIFIFVIFVLCLAFSLLPLKIIKKAASTQNSRLLSFCNCFSGGVFLGTCHLQLIPFIEDKFNDIFYHSGYPLYRTSVVTQATVILGFFLILLIEQIVRVCQKHEAHHSWDNATLPVFSHDSHEDDHSDGEEMFYSEREHMLKASADVNRSEAIKQEKNSTEQAKESALEATDSESHSHSHFVHHPQPTAPHGHSHLTDIIKQDFGLRCIFLLFALSVHSLLEGVSLGLQEGTYKVVTLFIGVAVHEVLVSFAVGTNLAQQNLRLVTVLKLCLVFSATIPVGMVVGLCLKGITSMPGQVTSAIVQGLTAGTFIYVTFLEILPTEVNAQGNCLWKVFFMFLGFAVIACLNLGFGEGNSDKPYYQIPANCTGTM